MTTPTSERPSANTQEINRPWPKALLFAWLAAVALLVLVWLLPVQTGMVRTAILLCAALSWAGALALFRSRRVVTAPLVAIAGLVVAVAVLPGSPPDEAALRDGYVSTLRAYAGAPYVWGGETHRGIDCSGLVRCALAQASFEQGVRAHNPRLLRQGFALWWTDASASAMQDGAGGKARRLFESAALNDIPAGRLEPGDFAVTRSGSHTLAYLGDNNWIAADPLARRVVTYHAPEPREPYFKAPMVLLRWNALEDAE